MVGAFLGILMVWLLLMKKPGDDKPYDPKKDGINILCPDIDRDEKKLTDVTCVPGNKADGEPANIIQMFLVETFATCVFVSQIISLKYYSQIKEGITAGISVGITLFAMLSCT